MHQLTTGAVWEICKSGNPPPNFVLQVLNVKQIPPTGANSPERFRLIVSDGVHLMQGMIGTNMNDLVKSSAITINTIIRVTKFIVNPVGQKKILIVLDLDVLTPHQQDVPKVGDPVSVEEAAQRSPQSMPMAQPGQSAQQTRPMQQARPMGSNAQPYSPAATPMQQRTSNDPPPNVFTIKSLNPYQNRWTIRARVLSKTDIKRFKNARGDGQLFSVVFSDDSGEIKATGFGDTVNMFYSLLQVGQVYYVSKCALKVANKQWATINNEYEMNLETSSSITLCTDFDAPPIRYHALELSRLLEAEVASAIDVIAVVKDVKDATTFTTKKNTQSTKRELTLCDQSGWSVRLTLWGNQAESFNHYDNPVIAFKGVKVSDFDGRSLSCTSETAVSINPDLPEAHRLKGWFDSQGRNLSFNAYSREGGSGGSRSGSIFIGEIGERGLGAGDKPEYFSVYGTVVYIRKENAFYPACANPAGGCSKKMMDLGGEWRCERCDLQFPAPIYRYIMSFTVCDATGQVWLQSFNDDAERMIGRSANEMAQLKVK